jgi:hypothetical protein
MTHTDLQHWANTRETAYCVARIIEILADSDENEMQRIWEDPTEDEVNRIVQDAIGDLSISAAEVPWGFGTLGDAIRNFGECK